MYKLEQVSLAYGSQIVLANLNINFEPGKLIGIMGPNSSGKTTLLKSLAGLMKPQIGQVKFLDKNLYFISAKTRATKIAMMMQPHLTDVKLTVREYIELGCFAGKSIFSGITIQEHDLVSKIIEDVDLNKIADKLVCETSSGEQQRIQLARVLAQRSSILLLDEPIAHLDLKHQFDFMEYLKKLMAKQQLSCIIVLHSLFIAKHYCEEVILLKNKEIFAAGSTKEVLTRENVKKVYDLPVDDYLNNLFKIS